MADVGPTYIKVQQTLHGYDEGHRLVVGAATLPQRDLRTMLVLSDASGSGALPPEGYLTGYPLQESAKYVVSRTWPAPEITRPGCVWTHSLLIAFSDLPALSSADAILSLFARPHSSATLRRQYEGQLEIRTTKPLWDGLSNIVIAERLVGAVYGKPNKKIVGGRDLGIDDRLLLLLWLQQWPRLRRSFRFCSFTSIDRSTATNVFDLQLFPTAERALRAKVSGSDALESSFIDPVLEPAARGLLAPDFDDFRAFLKEAGGDVGVGRSAMRPLCQIFSFLKSSRVEDASMALDAVAHLEKLGKSQASSARAAVARELCRNIQSADDRALYFVVENAAVDDEDMAPILGAVVEQLWLRDPSRFAELAGSNRPLSKFLRIFVESSDDLRLLEGVARSPSIAPFIVERRRDVLSSVALWAIPDIDLGAVLNLASGVNDTEIVAAMLVSGRTEASLAFDKFGARAVIAALESSVFRAKMLSDDPLESEVLQPWLEVLARQQSDLSNALQTRELTFLPLLVILAALTDPDDAQCGEASDPWIDALRRAYGRVSLSDADVLNAFILARGLGGQTSTSALLLAHAVEEVHRSLADQRMPEHGWRLVLTRLPWVVPWMEWDRCGRVRYAVAGRFVDRDLDPLVFGAMIADLALWREFARTISWSRAQKQYLKRVRDAVSAGDVKQKAERLAILDNLLK